MRREAIVLALAMLAPAAAALTTGPAGSGQASPVGVPPPHPSIEIEGDEGFEQPMPLNGVRSGSGTAEDPYTISDWTIVHTAAAGIRLVDTTSHVVIEDVVVPGYDQAAPSLAECTIDPEVETCGGTAIELRNATNVTVRGVRVMNEVGGVVALGSENVTVERSHLRPPDLPREVGGLQRGIVAYQSEQVLVRNVTVERSTFPVVAQDSRDVRVERSSMRGYDPGFDAAHGEIGYGAENVSFVQNEIENWGIGTIGGGNEDVRFAENVFSESWETMIYAEFLGHRVQIDGLRICGNTFERTDETALHVASASDIVLHGNVFEDLPMAGVVQGDSGLSVEDNLLDTFDRGLVLGTPGARAHGNSIVAGTIEVVEPANVTRNWWNHTDGPNVTFEDEEGNVVYQRDSPGEKLEGVRGVEPAFDPWLEEPPDRETDCVPGEALGPAGASGAGLPGEAP